MTSPISSPAFSAGPFGTTPPTRTPAGVLVGGVVPNGPAEKAGLEIGDVITGFDGEKVRDVRQLKHSVADVKPGQTVPVEVLRDGSCRMLRVTIRQASTNDSLAKAAPTADP